MTQAISVANLGGYAGELAALVLENEQNQSESARAQRDAARQSYLDQAEQQVEALHAAASASCAGALVGASLTMASGALEIGAASYQFDAAVGTAKGASVTELATDKRTATILGDLGDVSSKLAGPLQTLIGDSTAGHYQAEAKRHETLAAQAQWQASDASAEIEKANKQADKMLDLAQEIQRDQNAATNALINRI
jgi:hypothetical protein